MPPALAGQSPFADQVTHFWFTFLSKAQFYSILSCFVRFRFALQIARAEEKRRPESLAFQTAFVWLLVIGLLHADIAVGGRYSQASSRNGFSAYLFAENDAPALKWAFALNGNSHSDIFLSLILFVALFRRKP